MSKLISFIALLPLACGHARTQRTIEPGNPSGGDTTAKKPADDFTISKKPDKSEPAAPMDYPIHLADKWFPFRAEYLGITPEEAMRRDSAISDLEAGSKVWDEQVAIEAVSIWGALCNECHGGRRRIKDALAMEPPRAGWGRGEGLFFGKRRPYKDIFRTISGGGPIRDGKPSEMPAWGTRLAREQIWALIYFLEYQSGGIEGVFPPSLYPKGGIPSGLRP